MKSHIGEGRDRKVPKSEKMSKKGHVFFECFQNLLFILIQWFSILFRGTPTIMTNFYAKKLVSNVSKNP